MWWTDRQRETDEAFKGIYGRLEQIESAPVVRVDRDRVIGLESKLGALGKEVELLATELDVWEAGRDDLRREVSDLSARIDHQTLAISEGIERVTRAENRINNTVQRARKELKKLGYTDAGLEAENRELHLLDAEGSDASGLREVPQEVGEPDDAPSTVPGITVGQLRRARGMA